MTVQRIALLIVLLVAPLSGCASTAPDWKIEAMVASAASPAEHRRVAAYYREQAAQARASGDAHRHLAEIYGDRQSWGVAFTERARQHCDKVGRSRDESAAQYEFLAVQHDLQAQK